jgi:hypothetical protein
MAGELESRHVESAACLSADKSPADVLHPCPAAEKVGQAFLPVRSGAWGAAVLTARARCALALPPPAAGETSSGVRHLRSSSFDDERDGAIRYVPRYLRAAAPERFAHLGLIEPA